MIYRLSFPQNMPFNTVHFQQKTDQQDQIDCVHLGFRSSRAVKQTVYFKEKLRIMRFYATAKNSRGFLLILKRTCAAGKNKGTLFCPSSTALKDKRDFENSKEIERQLFVDDVINWQALTDLEYQTPKKRLCSSFWGWIKYATTLALAALLISIRKPGTFCFWSLR